MIEVWKNIPGYEGQYQVSTLGNVRSLDRVITCEGKVKGKYTSLRKGKLLRPGRSISGHLTTALGRNNSRCVHELVLLAFVGPAPVKHECRHLNGNPADNRLENLKWGTRSENIKDKTAHGLSKLKPLDVAFIKKSLINAPRGTQAKLARQFNVTEGTIWEIKKGRTHV
jgi:hypothetical protein